MAPPLLALKNASLRIGRLQLLDGIDAAVAKGDRIGLVGRNGAGKSTLLRLLAGEIELDNGERFLQPRTTVAYLPQEPMLPAGDDLARIVATGLGLAAPDEAATYRAEMVLAEFGLDPHRAATGLSGGETRRVALARLLVAEPDLVLLDEPTNHLDLETIEWLEQRLGGLTAGIVLVSHDRAFLERMTRATWWIDRGRLRTLDAGYAGLEAWAELVAAAEEAELARLDKKLLVAADWLHKGVTARRRRNQGRLRQLMALRDQRRRHIGQQGSVKLDIQAGEGSGQLVIEAESISKSFGDKTVVRGFSTRILRRDRIGIIGPNGAGKTTLLRLLTGELPPDEGKVRQGTNLEIARLDQLRTALDPEKNLWETLCPAGGDKVSVHGQWRHVAGYLRDFLFRDEQLRQPVKALSGGERNRLLLAKTLAMPANLLILDEPTNDLDLDTLELLEESLADYPGTLLLVSHDRRFLDNLVTSSIVAEGRGRWAEYAGGYSDWLLQRQPPETATPRPAKEARPPPAPPKARATGFDAKLVRELERLPEKIRTAQERVAVVERQLHDPQLYARDPAAFAGASAELERLQNQVATLEGRWLELELQREQALERSGE